MKKGEHAIVRCNLCRLSTDLTSVCRVLFHDKEVILNEDVLPKSSMVHIRLVSKDTVRTLCKPQCLEPLLTVHRAKAQDTGDDDIVAAALALRERLATRPSTACEEREDEGLATFRRAWRKR